MAKLHLEEFMIKRFPAAKFCAQPLYGGMMVYSVLFVKRRHRLYFDAQLQVMGRDCRELKDLYAFYVADNSWNNRDKHCYRTIVHKDKVQGDHVSREDKASDCRTKTYYEL